MHTSMIRPYLFILFFFLPSVASSCFTLTNVLDFTPPPTDMLLFLSVLTVRWTWKNFSNFFSNRVKVRVKMLIIELGSCITKVQNCINLFLKPLQGLLMVISVKLLTASLWKIGLHFYILGTKRGHHTVSVNDLALHTCLQTHTPLSSATWWRESSPCLHCRSLVHPG